MADDADDADAPKLPAFYPQDGFGGDDATESGAATPAESTDAPADTAPASIIDSIDTAIADGLDVQAYTANGVTVQLRSLDDLLKARRYFQAEANRKSGFKQTLASFDE